METINQAFKNIITRLRRVLAVLSRRLDYLLARSEYLGSGPYYNIDRPGYSFRLTFHDRTLDPFMIQRIEGRREPQTTASLQSLLVPGDYVLELGGCYGYFTTIIALAVGSQGKVVSVEGLPSNYSILEDNIAANSLDNVNVYNYFVGLEEDCIYFRDEEQNPYAGITRFQSNKDQKEDYYNKGHKVRVVPVSKLLSELDFFPDLIFMDIEGFEREVIDDLHFTGLLKRTKPILLFETHPEIYDEPDLMTLVEKVKEADYHVVRIDDNILAVPGGCSTVRFSRD